MRKFDVLIATETPPRQLSKFNGENLCTYIRTRLFFIIILFLYIIDAVRSIEIDCIELLRDVLNRLICSKAIDGVAFVSEVINSE